MYQIYDFKQDIDNHISKKIPIQLSDKSSTFKNYLFKLKLFQLENKIPKNHDIFNEDYFLFIKNHILYIAKRIDDQKFDYMEIKEGIKFIRKLKLKQLFFK